MRAANGGIPLRLQPRGSDRGAWVIKEMIHNVMGVLDQLQKLDDLIIEHTEPPTRTVLRNQLALTREQIEAYQAASDRQDQTLSRQAETIEELQKENEQ